MICRGFLPLPRRTHSSADQVQVSDVYGNRLGAADTAAVGPCPDRASKNPTASMDFTGIQSSRSGRRYPRSRPRKASASTGSSSMCCAKAHQLAAWSIAVW